MLHVGAQGFLGGLGVLPGFGGQNFGALGQQHSGLTLHLHTVLQVFDDLDAVGQLHLQHRQRLTRQRRTRTGGVTLPGQGVGDVELGQRQQRLGLGGPFGTNHFLALGAFDFVELFAQRFGRALVTHAEFLEDFLHLLGCGVARQPFAHTRRTFTRGGGRKGTTGQRIQRMDFLDLGRCCGDFRGVGHFVARRKRKHENP